MIVQSTNFQYHHCERSAANQKIEHYAGLPRRCAHRNDDCAKKTPEHFHIREFFVTRCLNYLFKLHINFSDFFVKSF